MMRSLPWQGIANPMVAQLRRKQVAEVQKLLPPILHGIKAFPDSVQLFQRRTFAILRRLENNRANDDGLAGLCSWVSSSERNLRRVENLAGFIRTSAAQPPDPAFRSHTSQASLSLTQKFLLIRMFSLNFLPTFCSLCLLPFLACPADLFIL